MRQSRSIMGMDVLLEIVAPVADQALYEEIFSFLVSVDERFSTYKETSEVQRINRGEISRDAYSSDMQTIVALAEDTAFATDGYFSMRDPEGRFDPSGIVKGWAIQEASQRLWAAGIESFYLEIAGDIQTSGLSSEGKEWSIGIRNPFAHDEVVQVVYPRGAGVATSGTAARGAHIYNPHVADGIVTSPYCSLTVIGPNVYEADRFATPAFAMGDKGLTFIEALAGFEAYAIDKERMATMTSGFSAYT
jgi:thiamine biosynthesis lipoprotein